MLLVERSCHQKLSRDFPCLPSTRHGVGHREWQEESKLSFKKKNQTTQPHLTIPKRCHNWHPVSNHNRTCWVKGNYAFKSVLQVSHPWLQWERAGSLGQEETVGDANRGTERSADAQRRWESPSAVLTRQWGSGREQRSYLFVCCSRQLWVTAEEISKIQIFRVGFVGLFWFCYFFFPNKMPECR